MESVKRTSAFEYAQNVKIQIILAHAQNIIRVFALNTYILYYPMTLLADSEGPDQTAHSQAQLGLRCPHILEDTFLLGRSK